MDSAIGTNAKSLVREYYVSLAATVKMLGKSELDALANVFRERRADFELLAGYPNFHEPHMRDDPAWPGFSAPSERNPL